MTFDADALQVDRDDELPLGAQLARGLKRLIEAARPGERLPSVRRLAEVAGVNVNTARAVYARLEDEGYLVSQQGRGTFVADRPPAADSDGGRYERRELRRQIAELEVRLAAHPRLAERSGLADQHGLGSEAPASDPRGSDAPAPPVRRRPGARTGGLPDAAQLREIRDELTARLEQIDVAREAVLRDLRELDAAERAVPTRPREPARQSTSLAGARVRWV